MSSNQMLAKQGAIVTAGALVLYGALRLMRARVYDALIVNLTTGWYEHVLKRMPAHSKLLDVGIGTGLALANNEALLRAKDIAVDGVDYDLDYVKRCKVLMKNHRLDAVVTAHHASIYDYTGGPYDAVYFSSSLMIMPDPVAALKHTAAMLKPKGRVYVTQTIQTKRSKIVELGKPLLKFLTTIDFGNVTYEEDLLANFKKAQLTLIENVAISDSTMTSTRSFRIFVLEA
uniref:Methyltransferase domain-containing protein n=1 Tax=Globisporangium ultimum (strain ATCC 200006 / CBS 805.95 / DAOM BR144) TaxID=431595 RepID=K3X164_GLOUD